MSDHETSHESSWPSEHKWELLTAMGMLGAIGAVASKRLIDRYKNSDRYTEAVNESYLVGQAEPQLDDEQLPSENS